MGKGQSLTPFQISVLFFVACGLCVFVQGPGSIFVVFCWWVRVYLWGSGSDGSGLLGLVFRVLDFGFRVSGILDYTWNNLIMLVILFCSWLLASQDLWGCVQHCTTT